VSKCKTCGDTKEITKLLDKPYYNNSGIYKDRGMVPCPDCLSSLDLFYYDMAVAFQIPLRYLKPPEKS